MKKYRRRLPYAARMAIVFAAALLLFAAIVLTLHILGFRYVTCHRLDGTSVRFAGRVGSDGAPVLGVVLFPDGSKATVDRSDGSFVYSNGSRYSGRLDSVFEREGQGSITLKNGDSYTGDFLHDRLSGHGVYRFANGDVYEGDFVENKKQGFGKYTYADGEIYEGGFYDDMRHGQGKMSKPDGASYEGTYDRGIKSGRGKYVYPNGDVYEGDFADDMRHGNGTYTWADGESYTGEFAYNNINGRGTYTWTSGRASYTGYFVNGEIVLVDPADAGETKQVQE